MDLDLDALIEKQHKCEVDRLTKELEEVSRSHLSLRIVLRQISQWRLIADAHTEARGEPRRKYCEDVALIEDVARVALEDE